MSDIRETCKECGSSDLEWFCTQQTKSGVAEGRLNMHDVSTLFVLGCVSCSSTVKTMSGDKVAEKLNEAIRSQT